MAHVTASVTAVEATTHAARGKRMGRHTRTEHDDGQNGHCNVHAGRLPYVFIAKLNGDCLSMSIGCFS
jgi:hypothetical protein